MAAAQGGLPALGPSLQHAFGLSLVQVTGVFTAFGAGTVLTVYAWGALVDRIGERAVLAIGPALGGVALSTVVLAESYGALLAGVFVAGLFAAAATGGSGRAVFGWFPRSERGLALGLRQTSVQLGTAAASFTLPTLAAAFSLDVALLALSAGLVLSSVIAAIWLRDPPARQSAAPPSPPATRDPRIWRLGVASALLIVGQIGLTSLLVLYLYSERGWSATEAPSRSASSSSAALRRALSPAAGPTSATSASRRFAGWPAAPACCCWRPRRWQAPPTPCWSRC